jgi:hypothetical protein
MSDFAASFDRHVLPVLAARVRRNGVLVGCDQMAFSAALDDVLALARQRGAGYLDPPDFDTLEERIAAALCAEATRVADQVTSGADRLLA